MNCSKDLPPDRHLNLTNTIKAGLANMGGSAATISLGEVERASWQSGVIDSTDHAGVLDLLGQFTNERRD